MSPIRWTRKRSVVDYLERLLLGTQGRIHYGLCIRALLIDTLDEFVQLQDDIVLLLSILCLRTILLLSTKRKI